MKTPYRSITMEEELEIFLIEEGEEYLLEEDDPFFKWEYAFESKTEIDSQFRNIYPLY